jgi:lysyl-tRNA synthetase class 2
MRHVLFISNWCTTAFMSTWKPTTSHHARLARATMLKHIRQFFEDRQVLEVETPLLCHGTITDEHLDAFHTQYHFDSTGSPVSLYLQTSPEYAMKRLLCAESGAIYQICKAFRHEGEGRWHNPEFTMLEWYRPGFDHYELMAEVDALLMTTLHTAPADVMTYQQAFDEHIGICPLSAPSSILLESMTRFDINIDSPHTLSRDSMLQLLFSVVVEPNIGQERPCFIHSFPASQAALATINKEDERVADRFEVYFKGAELANGFNELSSASEQRKRFIGDNEKRQANGQETKPIDEHFLHALEHGLPPCAGVALGIDRLLMLQLGVSTIHDVINFPTHIA